MKISLLHLLRCPFCSGKFCVSKRDQSAVELEYNVLTCNCGRYPVVSGIPVLKKDKSGTIDKVIGMVEGGRYLEALLTMISPGRPALAPRWINTLPLPSKATHLLKILAHQWLLRGWQKEAAALLAVRRDQATACDIFDFNFKHTGAKGVYDYFNFRFGQPRHLVSLSFASLIHDL